MLKGLWRLTWLETKIFAREPLGLFGVVAIPVATFVIMGRIFRGRTDSTAMTAVLSVDMPILAVLLISLSAVLSLVTVIAIYREGGILKRLRATPLRPHTILIAHVLVKLLFTLITLALLLLAGKRYYPIPVAVPMASFAVALLLSTVTILSLGFVIASVVPTARFAQPIGSLVFYPMVALSGLFVPVSALPPAARVLSRVMPLTYVTTLLKGIWQGDPWSAHAVDVAALALIFAVSTAVAARVFRWE